jgi:hypothetical protein
MKQFTAVYPISGENLSALPVKVIGPAVAFYESVLGFTVVASDEMTATVQRDGVRLGLLRKPDHKPETAGSCAFAVADLDAMRRELDGRGLDLGGVRIDEWGREEVPRVLPQRGRERLLLLLQPASRGRHLRPSPGAARHILVAEGLAEAAGRR